MKYQLVLRKFDLDLDKLKKKISLLGGNNVSIDQFSKRLFFESNFNKEKFQDLSEVDKILIEETNKTLFKQESLKNDFLKICKKYIDVNLKIKTYDGVRIPASSIKKKLTNALKSTNIKLNESSESTVLVELLKENGNLFYRILSFNEYKMDDKKMYQNITVLIENPRLVEEISDFLRLCLVFGLKFRVIHKNKKEFLAILNKAKQETKGKLSDFDVKVLNNVNEVKDIKIGFTKYAQKSEKEFIEFLKKNKGKMTFVFGNDTFGLTQETRDNVDYLFSLTPEKQKPLKANQALAYVLGIYSTLNK